MPEMPLRVWSSRPTSLWPEAVLSAGFVLVVWTVKTFHVVWAFFPGLLLFILGLRLLNRRRPIPMIALAGGFLVAIGRDATHISLAAADLTITPRGCSLRWHDGHQRPTLDLPGFAGQEELAAALRTSRLETAPLRSDTLARLFPVVQIRPFWDWPVAAMVGVGVAFWIGVTGFHLSVLWLMALMPAMLWLESLQMPARWAMLTPDGLWVLMHGREPVLIPHDQLTGITTDRWGKTAIVRTAHPDYPALPVPTGKGRLLLDALKGVTQP